MKKKYIILSILTISVNFIFAQTAQTDSTQNVSYQTVTLWGTFNQMGQLPFLNNPVFEWTTDTTQAVPGSQHQVGSPTSGSGDFTSSYVIDGVGEAYLNTGTEYFYRAMIENKDTGIWKSFTTLSYSAPIVTTGASSNVGNTAATTAGNVTSDGGKTITERGVCYNTTGSPTTSDNTATTTGTTGEYEVNLTSLTPNTTYYFRAYAINSEGTGYGDTDSFITTGSTEWTGTSSTNWGSDNNWTDDVPTIGINAVIPSSVSSGNWPVVSTTAYCDDLTINAGGILTISTGNSLTVNGDFLMESSASESPSQFVVQGTGSISASSYTIEHYVGATGWRLISIPVASAGITTFSNYFVNSYDEGNLSWNNLNIGDNLTAGTGYSVQNSSGASKVTYTGTPNNGTQSIAVTNGNTGNTSYGWNLIGNPYPSTIDWDASSGWTRFSDSTVYYYDMDNSRYATYNHYTDASTNGGTRYIPPMQGFWIHANGDYTIQMTNAVRVSNQQDFWKKDAKVEQAHALKLISEGNGFTDDIMIGFNSEATETFDLAYDAYKLFSSETHLPQIYTTILPNDDLAVNILPSLSANFSIPIGFNVGVSGTYELSASGFETFSESTKFYIEDLYEDKIIDLEETSYEFSSVAVSNKPDRFVLHIQTTDVSIPTFVNDNNFQVYSYDNNIYVKSEENLNNCYVRVFNILGEEVYKQSMNTDGLFKIDRTFTSGTYIISIQSDRKHFSTKIVLN